MKDILNDNQKLALVLELFNAGYISDAINIVESYRPKGKWIGGTTDCFQCSNCSKLSFYPSYVKVTEVEWDYCPYCGADMRGE